MTSYYGSTLNQSWVKKFYKTTLHRHTMNNSEFIIKVSNMLIKFLIHWGLG